MKETDKSLTGFEKVLIEANAYSLLEGNPAFREATLETERSLIEDWANTASDQPEERERIWMKVQLLRDVLAEVERHYLDKVSQDFAPREVDTIN